MPDTNIMHTDFQQIPEETSGFIPIVHQSQIMPGTIKARHLETNLHPIVFGLAANRPTTTATGVFAYFATDTFVLSCYTGSAWKSVTLS